MTRWCLIFPGSSRGKSGVIDVYEDSRPDTLNDFLTVLKGDYLKPDVMRCFEQLTQQAEDAAMLCLSTFPGGGYDMGSVVQVSAPELLPGGTLRPAVLHDGNGMRILGAPSQGMMLLSASYDGVGARVAYMEGSSGTWQRLFSPFPGNVVGLLQRIK
ncbi:hypothetical protein CLB51_24625 [Salmonella enterica]|nr:hypothetical protein [Salmonella enterica]EBZ4888488.1 hypothetical protein [Salmonella enterica subsp. enterica serovar Bredeney]EDR9399220.1 hypothetical protein [Salmonella enterica subsp. enterica]EDT6893230.1 hypothetical protein [Salmonella enterica subsp. enterica serovar Javiana]EDX5193567.1 hypothetical protein [Salmonella enterica subsp. enterica serovar Glostrup]EHW1129280.1 prophage tail fiber N-terminal domain-containing protein [Salmonella enterica subsp. enterica serovar Kino